MTALHDSDSDADIEDELEARLEVLYGVATATAKLQAREVLQREFGGDVGLFLDSVPLSRRQPPGQAEARVDQSVVCNILRTLSRERSCHTNTCQSGQYDQADFVDSSAHQTIFEDPIVICFRIVPSGVDAARGVCVLCGAAGAARACV
nr:hypothetical protein BaRGS_014534 [Batillaria attramentaria]